MRDECAGSSESHSKAGVAGPTTFSERLIQALANIHVGKRNSFQSKTIPRTEIKA